MKAVVLCAGLGSRLRPISNNVPKALVSVNNRPLVDWALERVFRITDQVAVNVHAHRTAMLEHLEGRGVHISIEEPQPLGTAGAIGALKHWLEGEGCLIVNVDAFCSDPLHRLVDGWDGDSVRVLTTYDAQSPDFHGIWRFAGASLLPGPWAVKLKPEPSGMYEACWRHEMDNDALTLVPTTHSFVDCGTPGDLLVANLVASGGKSVTAPDAVIEGTLHQSLVLPGGRVRAGERLVRAIRLASGQTLLPFETSRLSTS